MKKWYVTFLAVVLVSCTDYVSQIEDERDEWRSAQELAALSSSSDIVKTSSSSFDVILSGDSHEKSSSSSVKSNDSSSSAVLSGDSREEPSSSSIKSIESSSGAILSSDSHEESSSSEDIVSSSSSKKDEISSSSKNVVSSSSGKASWAYLNPAISYGEMIDNRDGQVYKTIVIGEQTWMAENLNYRYMGKTLELDSMSFCYDNLVDSCYKYGRLYTWAAVMDSVGLLTAMSKGCGFGKRCSLSYNEQGICPDGWRLPNMDDYETLFDYVGGKDIAGKKLKSLSNGYWLNNGFGDDSYGFSVLPSGTLFTNGMTYGDRRNRSFIWSSSEKDSLFANLVGFNSNFSAVELSSLRKNQAFSVRCLKDDLGNVQNSSSSTIAEESSSSMRIVPPCKTATEDNCEYGELKDNRDGKTYKTVKIGNQWWMAENLNYRNSGNATGRYCYNDETSYCATYGHLYTWDIAQNACPSGWHVPNVDEFNTLLENTGGSSVAGLKLKSTSGWNSNGNGLDEYGFTALPAGTFDGHWTYNNLLNKTNFWSSDSGKSGDTVYGLYMGNDVDEAKITLFGSSSYGFSVRCIKD